MTEIDGFSEEELREWVKSKDDEFTFASSYADTAPHEYYLRENLNGFADRRYFEAFVKLIRQEGYTDTFYNKEFTYYVVGDEKYWTMGNDVRETKLINRDDKEASY